jgi:hypothetical protein
VLEVADRAFRALRALIRTVSDDPGTSQRVSLADTSVRITLTDGPGYTFTLYFDREPVQLGDNDHEAQIELAMTALQLEELTRGELALAIEIAQGHIVYRGPIRKFLRVIPILRSASRDWLAGPAHDPRLQELERSG